MRPWTSMLVLLALVGCGPSQTPASGPGAETGSPAPAEGPAATAAPEVELPARVAGAGELEAHLARLEPLVAAFQKEHPYRHVWMAIDRKALEHNIKLVKARLGDRGLCAVVKGDAYGLGIELVAPVFAPHADAFCVADNHGARALRRIGIRHRIIRIRLAGPDELADAIGGGLDLEEFVGSLEQARNIDELASEVGKPGARVPVHLVIDSTGMGRNGFPTGELLANSLKEIEELAQLESLKIVAITAHLPTADGEDFAPTLAKARRFLREAGQITEVVARHGHQPQWHLSNSAASTRLPDEIHAQLHMDRVGGQLYGMRNFVSEDLGRTREAVTVVAQVAAVHRREKGATVGYGSTESAPRDRFPLANIGVGWQNLPRQLSGKGFVVDARGYTHEVVGKLSMNTTVVEAEARGGPTLTTGEPVVLVSPFGPTIDEVATLIDQVPSYVTMSIARSNVARFAY